MIEVSSRSQIGYILRSYPRLSQTAVVNEILALEELGLGLNIFAVTDPHEPMVQVQVAEVRAPVHYLEVAGRRKWPAIFAEHLRVALTSPRRYLKTLGYVLRHPEFDQGYTASSRFECFIHAVYLAQLLKHEQRHTGRQISHLHAHFAHDPALIALLVHMLTGISYSFTTHARDLYQIPKSALVDRVAAATAVVTGCSPNVDYLNQIAPEPARQKILHIHHGVDVSEFQPLPREREAKSPLLLSASRLVEKKGYFDLVFACHRLKKAGYRFCCVIYGDGPLYEKLAAKIKQLGLEAEVTLAGACTQKELLPHLQRADIFVLTPFVTDDGDRDGVPAVLVEAMACGVPVVSTTVAGIPELITHDHDGLLAEPHDVEAIAAALAALLNDEPKRKQLGTAARQTVVERFDVRIGAQQMARLFDTVLKGEPWILS